MDLRKPAGKALATLSLSLLCLILLHKNAKLRVP